MRQQHKHKHRFLEEPVAWLFTGVKPGERRQFASVDDSVSQTWPTDNGVAWTIEPLCRCSAPIPYRAIGNMLNQAMELATVNGANSVSMPDDYVEVAKWLQKCST